VGEADPPEGGVGTEGRGGGEEKTPPDWFTVTDWGAGVRPNATAPSGPYFLGLPLFLFTVSPPLPPILLTFTLTMAPPPAIAVVDPPSPEGWKVGEVEVEVEAAVAAPTGL
jgi:hypothetical protein